MLIVCPSCASEYDIDEARLGPAGRTVRCASCRTTFHAAPPAVEAEFAEATPGPLASDAVGDPASALSVDASAGRTPAPPPAKRRPARAAKTGGRPFPLAAWGRGAAVAASLALPAGLVLAREAVVVRAPDTARLYAAIGLPVNLRGLDFGPVRSTVTGEGREATLTVEGEIANTTGKTVEIPSIAFAVSGPDGIPLYTWTIEPPRQTLGPGETSRFRSRLAAPPPESRQVLVRFAPARDGVAVARGR